QAIGPGGVEAVGVVVVPAVDGAWPRRGHGFWVEAGDGDGVCRVGPGTTRTAAGGDEIPHYPLLFAAGVLGDHKGVRRAVFHLVEPPADVQPQDADKGGVTGRHLGDERVGGDRGDRRVVGDAAAVRVMPVRRGRGTD